MTTRRNRPPSKPARRPEGARPPKPSRPLKGRPETREPRTDERGRQDDRKSDDRKSSDRKPSGRKFAERRESKFQERTFSERKDSTRKPSDRKFSGRKPFEDKPFEDKPSGRKFADRNSSARPSERNRPDRKSSDRKFSDHKSSDRRHASAPRFNEHEVADSKPWERETPRERVSPGRGAPDRELRDRKPRDGKPGERKPAIRKSRDGQPEQHGRAGRPPKERKPAGSRQSSRKFSERKFADRTPADRPPDSRKPFERKQFEGKPSGRSASERRSFEPRQPERNVVQPDIEADTPPVQLSATVQTVAVTPDENGMRVDRFLEARFAGLSFSHIQRIIRKGQLRVDGKRVEPKDRLEAGQSVRIPPLRLDPDKPRPEGGKDDETLAFLKSIMLYEDDDVIVLNKPAGLAVQGGSGTTRHIDGMLGVIRTKDGQRPRLVHRLDKDTAGCLLIAKSRFAAAALGKTFRSRSARKIYWALVPGVPKPKQGRVSTYLAKEEREDDSVMRVAKHGDEGASHAITYYAVVETAAARLAWLSLKPVTGRTHQLRVQLAHIGHPIVGDPKYFNIENWEFPGGIQNRLHLLARRIAVPHPRGGVIDATAPLPPHMQQSWNLIGLDASRYDPIEDAPEE